MEHRPQSPKVTSHLQSSSFSKGGRTRRTNHLFKYANSFPMHTVTNVHDYFDRTIQSLMQTSIKKKGNLYRIPALTKEGQHNNNKRMSNIFFLDHPRCSKTKRKRCTRFSIPAQLRVWAKSAYSTDLRGHACVKRLL
jgi:hypothetical protein